MPYAKREDRLAYSQSYWRTPEGRAKREAAQKAWKDRNREKVRAHSAVARALKKGTLVKPLDCEGCGPAYSGKLEAHHDDYSKPLEVKWLCDCCHKQRHIELRLEVRPMQAKRWKITDPELLGEDEPEPIEPEEPAPDPHYSDVPF